MFRVVESAAKEGSMPKNVAIGVGLMEFPFSGAATYGRWVDLCEAGGVDSIWQTDRLVSPTPFRECMSVMAALAGRTRRIKFGVNVLSLAMRDAVLVARQCATIAYLSTGRLLPAVGIGSPLGRDLNTLTRAAIRGLQQAHRPRAQGLLRDRRRRCDRRPDRRLCRGRRVEIHPASGGTGRRRDHDADPTPDRRGLATGRRALAKAGQAAR